MQKAMAPDSSTLARKSPWTEEPGGLQSMGSRRVGHDWATSLSLFTFIHWRREWRPTPVFLPGESQGRWSLVGCRLWGRTESDTTVTWLRNSSSSMYYNVDNFGWNFLPMSFAVVIVQSLSHVGLCSPMDCSIPGSPVLQQLRSLFKLMSIESVDMDGYRGCHPTILFSVVPFSSFLQSFPASESFLMSWLFTSGGQNIGASASVLPMNTQD